MAALESSLVSGETICRRTPFHWMYVWRTPIVLGAVSPLLFMIGAGLGSASGGLLLVAVLLVPTSLHALIRWKTNEFVVTTRRLMWRKGGLGARTDEIILTKAESVSVSQTLEARLWGFGTFAIRGSGGTTLAVEGVPKPLELHRTIQEAIAGVQEGTRTSVATA